MLLHTKNYTLQIKKSNAEFTQCVLVTNESSCLIGGRFNPITVDLLSLDEIRIKTV